MKLRHVLAGLQAGVLGAVCMMVWLMIGSRLSGRSAWNIPNLFATTFYGSAAYIEQYLRTSWSGVALLLAICGLGGMLWGLVWRDDRPPFLTLFGAIAGLAVYFIFFDLFWKRYNPLIPLYAPLRQLQIGYIIWGIALSRSPAYSRAIAATNGEPLPGSFGDGNTHGAAEVSSGEVIR